LLLSGVAAHAAERKLLEQYCVDCHDADAKTGGVDLDSILGDAKHPDVWESVVRQLNARHMPPAGKKRPDEKAAQIFFYKLSAG